MCYCTRAGVRGTRAEAAIGHPLRGVRCREQRAWQWLARYLGAGADDEDEEEGILFCPECARREFGRFDGELSPE